MRFATNGRYTRDNLSRRLDDQRPDFHATKRYRYPMIRAAVLKSNGTRVLLPPRMFLPLSLSSTHTQPSGAAPIAPPNTSATR
jgi:hypothetical protein